MEDLSSYEEMWTGDAADRYILIVVGDGLLPFVPATRQAVLIEDDELAKAVVARMLEAGVRVHDALPPQREPKNDDPSCL